MSIPEFVNSTPGELAYLSKLKQQYSNICQDIANAKRRPPKSKDDSWGSLIVFATLISFIPSCTVSLVASQGDFSAFFIMTIIISVVLGVFMACSIKESSEKEHSEWTPAKGEKKAKKIAMQNNFGEKEYLLSIFDRIQQYDRQIRDAEHVDEILDIKTSISIFQRKVFSAYQEVFRNEKSKSTKRYSKSVMYNRLLDGNYSASDHIRATKRIHNQEQSRLEGFVIALAHIVSKFNLG